jgi:hypothetical protein
MNIMVPMIAPYETVCLCGRTIPRPWPPYDADAVCEQCARATADRGAQPSLPLGCFDDQDALWYASIR